MIVVTSLLQLILITLLSFIISIERTYILFKTGVKDGEALKNEI